MEIVLRRVPRNEELLYFVRRCAARALGPHAPVDDQLRLTIELVSGKRYRVSLDAHEGRTHHDLSPDPYIAIGNVFAKAAADPPALAS